MERRLLEALNAERRARRAAILVSDLGGGPDRLLREGEPVEGALGEAANSAFASGKSGPVSVDGRELFLAVHLPEPRLVLIGAVHIAQALAPECRVVYVDNDPMVLAHARALLSGAPEGHTNGWTSLSGDDETTLRGWWDGLAAEGTVTLPLEKAPWGDSFGQLTDKFGLAWMFNIAGTPAEG